MTRVSETSWATAVSGSLALWSSASCSLSASPGTSSSSGASWPEHGVAPSPPSWSWTSPSPMASHVADAFFIVYLFKRSWIFGLVLVQSPVLPLLCQHVRFHISDHADESPQAGGDSVAEECQRSWPPQDANEGAGGTLGARFGSLCACFGFQEHRRGQQRA